MKTSSIVATLYDVLNGMAIVVTLLMALHICIGIIARAFFSFDVPGTATIVANYYMTIGVFGGMAYASYVDEQIRVDVVYKLLGKKPRVVVNLIADLASFAFLLLLAYSFYLNSGKSIAIHEYFETAHYNLPLWPVKVFITVCAFMACLGGLRYLLRGDKRDDHDVA